jgi:hypothetical protein
MNKDELFDVIIKGFGVAFLFLAIMAIPKALEGLLILAYIPHHLPKSEAPDNITNLLAATWPGMIASCIGAVIKFIIFIIASINFLRSGSWVKKLMGQQRSTPQGE